MDSDNKTIEGISLNTKHSHPANNSENKKASMGCKISNIFIEYLFIKWKDIYKKVLFRDINYIEAGGSYCNIIFISGEKWTIVCNLSTLEKHLSKDQFLRTHRSFIVNIKSIEGYTGNMLYLVNNCIIPIGRIYKDIVLPYLNLVK